MTDKATHWSVPGAIDEAMAAHNALSADSRELLHHVCAFGMDLFAANRRLARELAGAKQPLMVAVGLGRRRFKRTQWGDEVAQAPERGAACLWFDGLKAGELETLRDVAKGKGGYYDLEALSPEEREAMRNLPSALVRQAQGQNIHCLTRIGRLVLCVADAGHRGTQ